MAYNFRPVDREQMYLMPPCLRDWLPQYDLVWFIIEGSSRWICLSFTRSAGRTAGASGLRPVYDGYASALRLLHGGAFEPKDRVAMPPRHSLPGNHSQLGADHSTIARFRQENERELAELFVQVLRLCAAAGATKCGDDYGKGRQIGFASF